MKLSILRLASSTGAAEPRLDAIESCAARPPASAKSLSREAVAFWVGQDYRIFAGRLRNWHLWDRLRGSPPMHEEHHVAATSHGSRHYRAVTA